MDAKMSHNIKVKSSPKNFRKEFLNLKRNTIRIFEDNTDIRKEICDRWIKGEIDDVTVTIQNTETNTTKTNQLTDITLWNNIYILSW